MACSKTMDAKENALRIIRFDRPERVEGGIPTHTLCYHGCNHESFGGRGDDSPVGSTWVDIWGTTWRKIQEGVMGLPIGNPLADVEDLGPYQWPNPDDERICGHVEGMLDTFMTLGVDVLNPIQATANDLGRVRALTQGRMALKGGVSSATVMGGPPERIVSEVRQRLWQLGQEGGYFCVPRPGVALPAGAPRCPARGHCPVWSIPFVPARRLERVSEPSRGGVGVASAILQTEPGITVE